MRQNYLLSPFCELYVFVLQTKTRKMILTFASFFKFLGKFLSCFLVFPSSGARESPLRFDN